MARKAFTLMEVLVVIAVIGGLLAILLPSLKYCKKQAQAVSCASNIRQLTVLLNTYSQFQSSYPLGFCDLSNYFYKPPGGYVGNASYDWMGWWWFHFLMDDQEAKKLVESLISCPSSVIKKESVAWKLCGNYGINYSICKIANTNIEGEFIGHSIKPDIINQPSRVLLLADSGYALLSWKATILDTTAYAFESTRRQNAYYVPGLSINSQKTINSSLEEDALKGRHPSLAINVGFADGSVKKIPSETLRITTEIPSDCPAYLTWSPWNKK